MPSIWILILALISTIIVWNIFVRITNYFINKYMVSAVKKKASKILNNRKEFK